MSIKEYLNIQPKVIKMLLNSYNKQRLAHAYLFEGAKGTKKKALAIELAKLLYCEKQGEVCNECINCIRIEHQNHPNVLVVEADNNTIKKEQVLYLQQEYHKTTLEPGPKVYIIDKIEKMSINAANSILKFIEEPVADTYTILTTDNLHQILPTIISRCQVINFQPIPKASIVNYLIENGVDTYIAGICSHLTNDFDKALEIANNDKIINIIDLVIMISQAILNKQEDIIVLLENSNVDLTKDKKVSEYFLDVLLIYLRDIQNVKNNNFEIVFVNDLNFIQQYVVNISKEKLIYNINEVLKAKINLEYNANLVLLIDHLLLNLM